MGMLDRFFGPPSHEAFAKLVMRTLKGMGDTREPTLDESEFRITFTEGGKDAGMMNLHNVYLEYCNAPKGEKDALLRRTCSGLLQQAEVPEEFEDAKHDLLPSVRCRSMLDVMRLDIELRGGTWKEMAHVQLSEHLVISLVYDLPTTMHFVMEKHLEDWNTSIYEALEVAKQNLEEKPFSMASLGEKVFVFMTGDAFDATRMLLTDKIRSLKLSGDPVAIPISRDSLIVTGCDDDEGLGIMADIAEKERESARPVCPIPHKLNGDQWEPWSPDPGHPHAEKFRMLELKYLYGEYAEQKQLHDKRNEQIGQDVFVATFSALERDGKVMSYSVWSKEVPTWLPKTEYVGLFDPIAQRNLGFVKWDRLHKVASDLLTPLDLYPPRWHVTQFPSEERVRQLEPDDWAK